MPGPTGATGATGPGMLEEIAFGGRYGISEIPGVEVFFGVDGFESSSIQDPPPYLVGQTARTITQFYVTSLPLSDGEEGPPQVLVFRLYMSTDNGLNYTNIATATIPPGGCFDIDTFPAIAIPANATILYSVEPVGAAYFGRTSIVVS